MEFDRCTTMLMVWGSKTTGKVNLATVSAGPILLAIGANAVCRMKIVRRHP